MPLSACLVLASSYCANLAPILRLCRFPSKLEPRLVASTGIKSALRVAPLSLTSPCPSCFLPAGMGFLAMNKIGPMLNGKRGCTLQPALLSMVRGLAQHAPERASRHAMVLQNLACGISIPQT